MNKNRLQKHWTACSESYRCQLQNVWNKSTESIFWRIFVGLDGVKIDDGGDFSFSQIGQLFHHTEPSYFAELRALFYLINKIRERKSVWVPFLCGVSDSLLRAFLQEMSTRSYFFYLISPLTAFNSSFAYFGSFLDVLDGLSLHFLVTGLGRKVLFTSLSSSFGTYSTLKELQTTICHFTAFTTHDRVLSPHFSASTSSNGLLLSLSGFVTLTWMMLALFSSPYFIFL